MNSTSSIEHLFRLLSEGIPDYSIVLLDPDGTIISWTPNAALIEGFEPHDVLGESIWRVWSTQEPPVSREILRQASEQRVELSGWRVRTDGSRYWAEETVTASRNESGDLTGFVRVTRDVTEQRILQEQLQQAQTLEAIGRLAGGIAHDFNNLLTAIRGHADLGLLHLSHDSPARIGPRAASRRPNLLAGEYVRIRVKDNGSGMDAQTLARAFEPFFTTKGPGKGTGLGLATVYGIIQQAGGDISVQSEPGRGTTFDILLPQVTQVDEMETTETPVTTDAGSGETVLLVEDEDAVRSLTSRILRKYGYSVLEARDGTEAVEVSQRFPGYVHLLLTDVVMPKMSGREVAERLTDHRPGIRVLYMSGYTDDELLRHGVTDRRGACFLEKPFTPEGLQRAIRECLDR